MENPSDKKEQEGEEPAYYYLEGGLVVFTEAYHLKRGYCCKCGCRHCPSGNKKEVDPELERW